MSRLLDITSVLEGVVSDAAERLQEFAHIDPSRILLCVSSARSRRNDGVFARIHPLRFPDGERSGTVRRGRRSFRCEYPSLTHRGNDILYVMYFLVPRFLDLPLREKLITLFHELYHISPRFDGDIRRFPGRNYAHGSSRKRYNERIAALVDSYLVGTGSPEALECLQGNAEELHRRYPRIVGRRMPVPRLTLL